MLRCARNDVEMLKPALAVIPCEGGGSSTLRLLDSITAASGILDHPHSRVMTTEYGFAISRRDPRPRFASDVLSLPRNGGCRECRVLAAPAVSCAMSAKECAHEHTGTAEAVRHSLRNGLTAYAVVSPEPNSSGLRHCRISGSSKPGWASQTSVSLAPATGVRTTRFCRTQRAPSSCAPPIAHEIHPPCDIVRADALASTASHPAFVTTAIRPSCRDETRENCR